MFLICGFGLNHTYLFNSNLPPDGKRWAGNIHPAVSHPGYVQNSRIERIRSSGPLEERMDACRRNKLYFYRSQATAVIVNAVVENGQSEFPADLPAYLQQVLQGGCLPNHYFQCVTRVRPAVLLPVRCAVSGPGIHQIPDGILPGCLWSLLPLCLCPGIQALSKHE